jgi:hypothetical protein
MRRLSPDCQTLSFGGYHPTGEQTAGVGRKKAKEILFALMNLREYHHVVCWTGRSWCRTHWNFSALNVLFRAQPSNPRHDFLFHFFFKGII